MTSTASALRRRVGGVLAMALVVIVSWGAAPASVSAHPMSTSAVALDIARDRVSGEIQLPIDRLAVAVKQADLTATTAVRRRAALETYVAQHISATSTSSGSRWDVDVTGGHVETIDGTAHFVTALTLTPPAGAEVSDFALRYDVIIEELVTHRAIATIRTQWEKGTVGGETEALGVFDWSTSTRSVDADGGSWLRGFAATAGLGVAHIAEGADHLLFLLMLLIPAPLIVRGGRWQRDDDARRSSWRIVHVVTAFAVGHSVTLALAAVGLIQVPTRPVESLIALSIFVSAVHAIRPIVPRGEPLIAGVFGLVHGLAFAALIGELGLNRTSLVSSLLGFNLGIELTQLMVVALMMPSLYVLSRTRVYPAIRVGIASLGLALSGAWFLERTALVDGNPLGPISEALVAHPFAVAAAVAVAAAIARSLPAAQPHVPNDPQPGTHT